MATQAECAEWLDMSERRFRELLDDGTVTRADKGQYDLKTVVREYVRNIREVAAGRAGADEQVAKAGHEERRAKALADKAEMEVSEMRGELVPADQIADAVHGAVQIMKTRILAVPAKAAPRVGAKSVPAAEKVIRDEIIEALDELSKVKVAGAPAAAAA